LLFSLYALAQTQTVTYVHLKLYPMFDFEKLVVYQKSKEFNSKIHSFLLDKKLDRITHDQLKRAAFSVMLNIAEGSGRFTKPDKRNFYIIGRGSAFECVAVFDFLLEQNIISRMEFDQFYQDLEEISKMLFVMIRKLK
jgi:four helix bundle protein